MSEITITATDDDGTVIGETTLDADPDRLADIGVGASVESGRRRGFGLNSKRRSVLGALAGVGLLSAAGTASAADRSLRIVGEGERATYECHVSGHIDGGDADDTTTDAYASGQVSHWSDSYRFSGDITSFSLEGEATVYVDGERVSASALGGGGGGAWAVVDGVTADHSASDHEIVLVDASGGGVDVTLPDPQQGVAAQVKKVDATDAPVRLISASGAPIDGRDEHTITKQYTSRTAWATDTDYYFI